MVRLIVALAVTVLGGSQAAAGSLRVSFPGTTVETAERQRQECDSTRGLRVLFVGNSFTYGHNVPILVQEIAAAIPGPCVQTSMIAVGGATLEDHWRSDSAASRIRGGSWTHVILNDQSTFGEGWWVEGEARVGTSGAELAEFGKRFADVTHQIGGTPVLLAHWTNAGARLRDQQALDYLFAKVGRETSAEVAPVGRAIKRMEVELPNITPYHADEHHLSAAGAYLEALVLYATLTGRPATGAPHRIAGSAVELNRGIISDSVVVLVELSESDAIAIQQIAATSYDESRRDDGTLVPPSPLSVEFPTLPQSDVQIAPHSLIGHWSGVTRALGSADDPATIEFQVTNLIHPSGADTMRVRTGGLYLAGPATVQIDGTRAFVRASLLPVDWSGRGNPLPLPLEAEVILRDGEMVGIVRIDQRVPGSTASSNFIGRMHARRSNRPVDIDSINGERLPAN